MKILKLAMSDQSYQQAFEQARTEGLEIGQYVTGVLEDALASIRDGASGKRPSAIQLVPQARNEFLVTITQLHEVCRLVWQEHKDFNDAVRAAAARFNVHETTIRDKCTRRIEVASTEAFLNLLRTPQDLIGHLCGKYPKLAQEIKKQFSSILPGNGAVGAPVPVPRTPQPPQKVHEMELVDAIIGVLKRHGGKLDKPDVEREVFKEYKEIFEHPWYQESVGNDTPRWLKDVDFARNTACNKLGLIKSPKEAGRGVWELTKAGANWAPR